MIIIERMKNSLGADNCSYIIMIIYAIFWFLGLMNGAENKKMNFVYVGFYRGLSLIIINYPICRIYQIRQDFPNKSDFRILIIRNLIISLQNLGIAYSMKYLQPQVVHTIANTGPIIVFCNGLFHVQNAYYKDTVLWNFFCNNWSFFNSKFKPYNVIFIIR